MSNKKLVDLFIMTLLTMRSNADARLVELSQVRFGDIQ